MTLLYILGIIAAVVTTIVCLALVFGDYGDAEPFYHVEGEVECPHCFSYFNIAKTVTSKGTHYNKEICPYCNEELFSIIKCVNNGF